MGSFSSTYSLSCTGWGRQRFVRAPVSQGRETHLLPLPPQGPLRIILCILGTPVRLLLDLLCLGELLDIPLDVPSLPLALARSRSLGRLLASLGRFNRRLRHGLGGVGKEVAEEVDRVGEEGTELVRGEEEGEELLERVARFGELFGGGERDVGGFFKG